MKEEYKIVVTGQEEVSGDAVVGVVASREGDEECLEVVVAGEFTLETLMSMRQSLDKAIVEIVEGLVDEMPITDVIKALTEGMKELESMPQREKKLEEFKEKFDEIIKNSMSNI